MRLFIVTLSVFAASCLASTAPSCFSKKTEEENVPPKIGTLYTDTVHCPPCQWLEKKLEENPKLLKKIIVYKVRLHPDLPYPKDYPESPAPDFLVATPTLVLKDGDDVMGADSILEKLMED